MQGSCGEKGRVPRVSDDSEKRRERRVNLVRVRHLAVSRLAACSSEQSAIPSDLSTEQRVRGHR